MQFQLLSELDFRVTFFYFEFFIRFFRRVNFDGFFCEIYTIYERNFLHSKICLIFSEPSHSFHRFHLFSRVLPIFAGFIYSILHFFHFNPFHSPVNAKGVYPKQKSSGTRLRILLSLIYYSMEYYA